MTALSQDPRLGPFRAVHFDGQSGVPLHIEVTLDLSAQRLSGPGIDWPLADVRGVPDQAINDLLILQRADDPVQRILLSETHLARHFPKLEKRTGASRGKQIFAWALGAITSVALIIFVLVPTMANQLANFIPPEGERALGEVTLDQIRDALDETGVSAIRFCSAPAGIAALDTMRKRLSDNLTSDIELTVHVLDHDMVNAFALPGGHLVFFRGLIDKAEDPEEIAAVFAHEIGHVVSRDPTRHALRSAGSIGVLGLLFGDFAGGTVVLFLAERLIDAQYSQGAEAAADVFAHDLMLKSKLPPDALAIMFERFRELGGDAQGYMAHFVSHPELGDRIAAARDATPRGFQPDPLLTDAEWRALQKVCDRTTADRKNLNDQKR